MRSTKKYIAPKSPTQETEYVQNSEFALLSGPIEAGYVVQTTV